MSAAGRSGKQEPLKLLLDTNVWLDYFLARSSLHRQVTELVTKTWQCEDVALYAASFSLKDVAFLLERDLKSQARTSGEDITLSVSAAAKEAAWGCVRSICDLALVVPVGHAEVMQAFTYKGVHHGFEDDLTLAAAARAGADLIVTHDQELIRHSPLPCSEVGGALELLATRGL